MKKVQFNHWVVLILAVLLQNIAAQAQSIVDARYYLLAEKRLAIRWNEILTLSEKVGAIKIDTIRVNSQNKTLIINFNQSFSYHPFREKLVNATYDAVKKQLRRKFRQYSISITSGDKEISTLVPNIYRQLLAPDSSRTGHRFEKREPFITRIDQPAFNQGLTNRNIALWGSHGRYYDQTTDRWQWQRPRLFGTVEDVLPLSFVLNYLAPMLENAGAVIWMPRERDTQCHEVIVDNDISSAGSEFNISGFSSIAKVDNQGFKISDTLFTEMNPFRQGSYLQISVPTQDSASIDYIPNIPDDGYYAIHVSYASTTNNPTNAIYTVYHTGGATSFQINQQIGGSTWIYLGTFHFVKGKNPSKGKVILTSDSGSITADAVRFGGGMGNVARRPDASFQWKTSGYPRYLEGARYYLQYAGCPDTLVYSFKNNKNDYADDYLSRGEWVNYLMGSPNGPEKSRAAGLGIPIDLALAVHTDAGIAPKDSIIGTLGIFSTDKETSSYPDGLSKMTCRDFADIIQTQLIDDLQHLANNRWSRRGLWDKQYSEAWRPNAPVMLLELLSHQNLSDMKYALDPRFQFVASRSIYKAILKYQSFQENRPYIVQPLPVSFFSIEHLSDKTVRLSWKPVFDTSEPSATPSSYKVYQRAGNNGFNNGTILSDTFCILTLEQYNQTYSFKVTALNQGGESFPSVTLSAGFVSPISKPVLVVDAFDRLCSPAIIDTDQLAGIAGWEDEGVGLNKYFHQTGDQYNFDRKSPWLSNDNPGWGASYANMEGTLTMGNSFDQSVIHGIALLAAGYSFVSTSDEAFETKAFDASMYKVIDFVAGEEKSTPAIFNSSNTEFCIYTPAMISKLTGFITNGGHLFLSGSYVGTDLTLQPDSTATVFARDILRFKWGSNHASVNGMVYATDHSKLPFDGGVTFNTFSNDSIYRVEAANSLEPSGKEATTTMRYHETGSIAAIAFEGKYKTVILGFPFETIIGSENRIMFMKQVMKYLTE